MHVLLCFSCSRRHSPCKAPFGPTMWTTRWNPLDAMKSWSSTVVRAHGCQLGRACATFFGETFVRLSIHGISFLTLAALLTSSCQRLERSDVNALKQSFGVQFRDEPAHVSVCVSVRLCICLSLRLSVYLPVCLFIGVYVCLPIGVCFCLPVCLSGYLPVYLPVCLPIGENICLPIGLYFCPCICTSVSFCLSVYRVYVCLFCIWMCGSFCLSVYQWTCRSSVGGLEFTGFLRHQPPFSFA